MKSPSAKAKVKAFTLVELLVVIVVVLFLAGILLSSPHDNHRPTTAVCMSNQKQIALGIKLWQSDNREKFPWEISLTNSGSMEAAKRGYAADNFRTLSDYLKNPSIFVCPTDKARTAITNFALLKNSNLSYFADIETCKNLPNSILTGDRHLQSNNKPVELGLFIYSTNSMMNWTRELHGNLQNAMGVLSFADGHVEQIKGPDLNSIFQREHLATNRLCIP